LVFTLKIKSGCNYSIAPTRHKKGEHYCSPFALDTLTLESKCPNRRILHHIQPQAAQAYQRLPL